MGDPAVDEEYILVGSDRSCSNKCHISQKLFVAKNEERDVSLFHAHYYLTLSFTSLPNLMIISVCFKQSIFMATPTSHFILRPINVHLLISIDGLRPHRASCYQLFRIAFIAGVSCHCRANTL